jgi:hypothetical protein
MTKDNFNKLTEAEKRLYKKNYIKIIKFAIAFKIIKTSFLLFIFRDKIKNFICKRLKYNIEKPKDLLFGPLFRNGPRLTNLYNKT